MSADHPYLYGMVLLKVWSKAKRRKTSIGLKMSLGCPSNWFKYGLLHVHVYKYLDVMCSTFYLYMLCTIFTGYLKSFSSVWLSFQFCSFGITFGYTYIILSSIKITFSSSIFIICICLFTHTIVQCVHLNKKWCANMHYWKMCSYKRVEHASARSR